MLEGGIQMDDLVTIIGEQAISNRLLEQEIRQLKTDLEIVTSQLQSVQRVLEMERGGVKSGDSV